MKPLKICIFSLYAYPMFNPDCSQVFGGAEVRASLLAKGLARQPGTEVSMVVFDNGQPDGEIRDGVRLIKWRGWPPSPSVSVWQWRRWVMRHLVSRPFVRTPLKIDGHNVHWRQLRSFELADADIYCAFGVSNISAELAAYCREENKRFVLFAASDYNFSEVYYDGNTETDLYGNIGGLGYYCIVMADLIFSQTRYQAQLCREEFDRDSLVVASPVDLTDLTACVRQDSRPTVLWVGKSDRVKQPLKAIELARRFPDVRFVMVMNRSSQSLYARAHAIKPENVDIIEHVPYHRIEELFAACDIFLSTSRFEGFPNTFLQAGKYAVPLLSLSVDPDGFIAREECGVVAGGDMDALADGLRRLLADSPFRTRCGENLLSYLRQHHDLDGRARQVWAAINHLVGTS